MRVFACFYPQFFVVICRQLVHTYGSVNWTPTTLPEVLVRILVSARMDGVFSRRRRLRCKTPENFSSSKTLLPGLIAHEPVRILSLSCLHDFEVLRYAFSSKASYHSLVSANGRLSIPNVGGKVSKSLTTKSAKSVVGRVDWAFLQTLTCLIYHDETEHCYCTPCDEHSLPLMRLAMWLAQAALEKKRHSPTPCSALFPQLRHLMICASDKKVLKKELKQAGISMHEMLGILLGESPLLESLELYGFDDLNLEKLYRCIGSRRRNTTVRERAANPEHGFIMVANALAEQVLWSTPQDAADVAKLYGIFPCGSCINVGPPENDSEEDEDEVDDSGLKVRGVEYLQAFAAVFRDISELSHVSRMCLVSLDLSQHDIVGSAVSSIVKKLPSLARLSVSESEHASVAQCRTSTSTLSALTIGLHDVAANLKRLDLHCIRPLVGAAAILQACHTLKSLNLSWSHFGDGELQALVGNAKEMFSLKELNLHRCGLGVTEVDGQLLGTLLSRLGHVKYLSLHDNPMSASQITAFGSAFLDVAAHELRVFKFGWEQCKAHDIDFHLYQMWQFSSMKGADAGRALASVLRKTRNLKNIDLQGVDLREEGFTQWAFSLELPLDTLAQLSIDLCGVHSLGWSLARCLWKICPNIAVLELDRARTTCFAEFADSLAPLGAAFPVLWVVRPARFTSRWLGKPWSRKDIVAVETKIKRLCLQYGKAPEGDDEPSDGEFIELDV